MRLGDGAWLGQDGWEFGLKGDTRQTHVVRRGGEAVGGDAVGRGNGGQATVMGGEHLSIVGGHI